MKQSMIRILKTTLLGCFIGFRFINLMSKLEYQKKLYVFGIDHLDCLKK